MNTLGQRLSWARERFGNKSSRRSIRAMGRELFPEDPKRAANISTSWAHWEGDRFKPQRGAAELAELLARLDGVKQAAVDPDDLAQWIVSGRGDIPGAPPFAAAGREGVVVMLEAGIAKALEALQRGDDARPVLESLLRILLDARQVGLAGIVAMMLALSAGTSEASDERRHPDSNRGITDLQSVRAVVGQLMVLLLQEIRARHTSRLEQDVQEVAAA